MNQKELGELRRRFRPEKSAVSRIYGCFVNGSSKEIISDLDEPLGRMAQEEAEKYLGFLKKALSGTLGKNLIDIVFSTAQVMDSEEHRLLTALRSSELKDHAARQALYQKIIGSLELESSYLVLLAHDSYDVPRRGRDDEVNADASDEVFSYIVCAVCPVKEGRIELGYFPGDNEFHCAVGQTVAAPELGFLFPAFDNRAANIYNALFYARKAEELHQEFIDAVFHVEPPMSAAEQREVFRNVLTEALEDECGMEVAQAVHEQLAGRIEAYRQSKDPEPLSVTAGEIAAILQDCGVSEVRTASFREKCGEQFGAGAVLNPANLIDAKRFELKTAQATVSIDPESSYLVEERVIDGKRYLLIPAEDGMELNGLPIQVREKAE